MLAEADHGVHEQDDSVNSAVSHDNTDKFDDNSMAKLYRLKSYASPRLNRYSALYKLPHDNSVRASLASASSVGSKNPRKRITPNYESLDYNAIESQQFVQEQGKVDPKQVEQTIALRWLLHILLGLYVAIVAIALAIVIKYLSLGKFMAIYTLMESCDNVVCLLPSLAVWMLLNAVIVGLGSLIIIFAPNSAGSGIPLVKCYLNGVKIPGLNSFRTLLAKTSGVCMSISGGLCCGKEGPMIHAGVICASTLSCGEYRCGHKVFRPKCLNSLKSDQERRDFAAAGTAAGVAAAFGSPIGGILFAMEEGASFMTQLVTWRMVVSAMTATLTLNICISAIKGHPGEMSGAGLVILGHLGDISYLAYELPIFALMGVFGGILGAAFIALNYRITMFRRSYIKKRKVKVAEAMIVAAFTALVFMTLIFTVPDCQPVRLTHHGPNGTEVNLASAVRDNIDFNMTSAVGHNIEDVTSNDTRVKRSIQSEHAAHGGFFDDFDIGIADHDTSNGSQNDIYGYDGHGFIIQAFCPYGQHSRTADILFKTPEEALHWMLGAPYDEWSLLPLIIVVICYHLLATGTFGLTVSSGVLIPSMLIGALWGRATGLVVSYYLPDVGRHVAKYALVGAAAQLAAIERITLSLTVIVLETTGDITFAVPIILCVVIAKMVGDFFTPGLYDLHIGILGIPMLSWEAPELSYTVKASEVMTSPVVCVRVRETLDNIKHIIGTLALTHNGYPVVDTLNSDSKTIPLTGQLRGFIQLPQLKQLVVERTQLNETNKNKEVNGTELVDLSDLMDTAPYSVNVEASLPRIFKLVRWLGLRHVIVTNSANMVVGIVTRINIARYRSELVKGKLKFEHLAVEDS